MKYIIHWIEYHVCDNEAEEKEWLDSLPNAVNQGNVFGDDVVEFECSDTFEAESIEEAKEKTKEYECGQENIFVVKDENGERVFTEEDVCYE